MRVLTVAMFLAVFAVLVGSSVGWGVSASDARAGSPSPDSSSIVTSQDAFAPRVVVAPQQGTLVKDRSRTYEARVRIPSEFDGDLNLALHVWSTGEGTVELDIPGRGAVPLPNRHYVPLYRRSPGTELSVGIDVSEAERTGNHSLHVELVYWNSDVQRRLLAAAAIDVVCPPECQRREFCRRVEENIEFIIAFVALVVSILSLYFWLLGRENVRKKLGKDEE